MVRNPLGGWLRRNNTRDRSSEGDTGPTIRALQGDIASQCVDVVVNAANERLGDGAGVAGAIHKAAGRGLLRECADSYPDGCPTGEARVTGGHKLPAKWIVHTVGPRWSGGTNGEPELLADCYRNSLQASAERGARTVAFPAISTGIFHYPREDAARVAVSTIREFVAQSDHGINEVILVAYDSEQLAIYERLLETEED
jgi:O-acetyl-ADP-ribose deacetylase (regulator of RNase III)